MNQDTCSPAMRMYTKHRLDDETQGMRRDLKLSATSLSHVIGQMIEVSQQDGPLVGIDGLLIPV